MWLSRLIRAFFLGALLYALVRYAATEPQTQYRLLLLLILPVVAAAWSFSSKLFREVRFLPFLLLGCFLLAAVVIRPTLTGQGYLVLALGWIALFLTLVLAHENPGSLFLPLVFVGGLEALYGLVQSLGGIDYIWGYHRDLGRIASGTFINRNHFAGLMNMTIPLGIGALFASFSSRRSPAQLRSGLYARTWIILLVLAFMGLAILLSLSRGGSVTLTASLLFIALMLALQKRQRKRRPHRQSLPARSAWILLFTILALGSWVGMDALLARFWLVNQEREGRIVVYQETLRLIAAHPWGIGPGMYEWRFRPYQSRDAQLLYDHAHNDYLQSAAEWGIPAALLFWAFVLRRMSGAARTFLDSRDPWRQGMALGCAGAIFSILLYSLVDFNLQITANWMIFCSILGHAWNLESV